MKVTINIKELQDVLSIAKGAIAKDSRKPVLQYVKLMAAKDKLTVGATNLDVAICYTVDDVVVHDVGNALVPAKGLMKALRNTTKDMKTVTIEADKDKCYIYAQDNGATLLSRDTPKHTVAMLPWDVAEYPDVLPDTEETSLSKLNKINFSMRSTILASMLDKTLFAVVKGSFHYACTGVYWEISSKAVMMTTTDGHRLSHIKTKLTAEIESERAVIIPSDVLQIVQKICKKTKQLVKIEVWQEGSLERIMFRWSNIVLTGILLSGNFLKYKDVIPKGCQHKVVIDKRQLAQNIQLLIDNTSAEPEFIRDNFYCHITSFDWGEDRVVLSDASTIAHNKVTCPVEYESEGIPARIRFASPFLLDILKVAEFDKLVFEWTDPEHPMLIHAGHEFVYVVILCGDE